MAKEKISSGDIDKLLELAAKNFELHERLRYRSQYAKNLKKSLNQINSAKAFKLITMIWSIRNMFKLSYICISSLIFSKNFRKGLLAEENKYDRLEYLGKITNSRAFKAVKLYWDLIDLLKEIANYPIKLFRISQTYKKIKLKKEKHNREEYLSKILHSKLSKPIRIYWPLKNLFTVIALRKNSPPKVFDKYLKRAFSSTSPLQFISKEDGSMGSDPRINKLLITAEKEEKNENWKKVKEIWASILQENPENEMLTARAKLAISIASRLDNTSDYKRKISEYRKRKSNKPKIVIYTANVGGYDTLKLPEKLDPRFDYVLFTDVPVLETGVFQIKPITYFSDDATRTARFVKTHPHTLLADYDIAIWIDSSILILGDIYPLVDAFIKSKMGVGAIPHPSRKNIYEEAESCILRSKDGADIIQKQINYYQSIGFGHDDLIESGLMMFNLQKKKVHDFLNLWWKEIDTFSKRDQLSLNFALAENKINWHRITKRPISIRNHPMFALGAHDSDDGVVNKLLSTVSTGTIDPYKQQPYSAMSASRIKSRNRKAIDIVICVHNAHEDVVECLNSVKKARGKNKNQRVVIVDDGSEKITADYLRKFDKANGWVTLVRNNTAVGYSKAANQGLKKAKGELVILLNSDTVVTSGWAEKMIDALEATCGSGIVGPVSNAAGHQSLPGIIGKGGQTAINQLPDRITVEDMNKYCEEWTPGNVLPLVPLIHGFCIGISRKVIDTIGYFDEQNFPKGYGEENDYCLRSVNSGFTLVVATHTYVYHKKTKSYTQSDRMKLVKRGSKKLHGLYGIDRLTRDIRSADGNLLLENLRNKAKKLYN